MTQTPENGGEEHPGYSAALLLGQRQPGVPCGEELPQSSPPPRTEDGQDPSQGPAPGAQNGRQDVSVKNLLPFYSLQASKEPGEWAQRVEK